MINPDRASSLIFSGVRFRELVAVAGSFVTAVSGVPTITHAGAGMAEPHLPEELAPIFGAACAVLQEHIKRVESGCSVEIPSTTLAAGVDFDNTLLHTEDAHRQSIRATAESLFGIPGVRLLDETFANFGSCFGIRELDSFSEVVRVMELEFPGIFQRTRIPDEHCYPSPEELRAMRLKIFKRDFDRYQIPEVAGARDLLGRLHSAGLLVQLVTSSGEELVRHCLDQARLDHFFHDCVFAEHVGELAKPDPYPYLLGAKRLELAPARGDCVAFEDSVTGTVAALLAGRTSYVRPSFESAEEFRDNLARKLGMQVAAGKLALEDLSPVYIVDSWEQVAVAPR